MAGKKKARKKRARRGAESAGTVVGSAATGGRFIELVADVMEPIVRAIVREEIRRRFHDD